MQPLYVHSLVIYRFLRGLICSSEERTFSCCQKRENDTLNEIEMIGGKKAIEPDNEAMTISMRFDSQMAAEHNRVRKA